MMIKLSDKHYVTANQIREIIISADSRTVEVSMKDGMCHRICPKNGETAYQIAEVIVGRINNFGGGSKEIDAWQHEPSTFLVPLICTGKKEELRGYYPSITAIYAEHLLNMRTGVKVNTDRLMLERISKDLEISTWQCPSCGHAEDTKTMDVALMLQDYLNLKAAQGGNNE